jgi:hypothetical protein
MRIPGHASISITSVLVVDHFGFKVYPSSFLVGEFVGSVPLPYGRANFIPIFSSPRTPTRAVTAGRERALALESTQPISLRLHLSRTLTELHEKLSKGE